MEGRESECSHLCIALIVVSVNGTTWFWTLSLATMRIILMRCDVRVTSLRSNWLALHHELAVDPLRWFADFARKEHWHSSDAFYQHFQALSRIWYTSGTYDQLNLGGVAATEEPARQIWTCVVVYSDPPCWRCPGAVFSAACCSSNQWVVSWRCSAGGDDAADECKVRARGADGTGRGKADKGRARRLMKGKKAVGGN